ncbi:MAG TPA: MFS transporter [Gaiellaceae bacterium]|nr:MFS transporter [Gaiellaceae bacterium]
MATTVTAGPSRARVLRAFRHRDFRLLWTGQAISLLGDAAFVVALGWRTFTLTGSARSLGLVLTFQGVGTISTVLVGGALADRYDRRTMMLVSDFARFLVIGALAVVDGTGHLSLGFLLVIALAEGLATGFFTPALGGLIPLVVEEPGLGSANALIGLARQMSFIIGPTIASVLYGFAGATVVFGFNAVSYLLSFGFVWATNPRAAERGAAEGTFREIRSGIRYVFGVPWLWITISLFAWVLMLQWAPIQVLTPKLVREHFGLGVRAYGLLFTAIGAGMVIGSVLVAQLNLKRRRGLISYLIWILNSVLVIVFALSPWYSLSVAAAFTRGICIGFGVTIWETMLMQLVPQHMLSRVVSLDWFGSLGLTPFGLLLVGAVSDLAPPGTLIALGAAISICIISLGLTSKQIRTID